jgi:replicative DNA helicase
MSDKRTETARALIGQVLWDRNKLNEPLVSNVAESDMPAHWGKVWRAVKDGATDVNRIALMLDPATLEQVGGEVSISETMAFGGGDYASEYARKLLSYTARLKQIDIARRIIAEAQAETDPDEISHRAIDDFARMSIDNAHELEALGEITRDVVADTEAARANPRDVWGIPLGLPKLDAETGGAHPGELTLLVGEPGVGKTWLALGATVDMARNSPGAVVSMEMRRRAVGRRILSGYSGVGNKAMQSGRVNDNEMTKIYTAQKELDALPVYMTDKSFTTGDMRAMLARAKSKYGIQWAVVDYLMLFTDNARDEIQHTANVSRALKNIASDLEIAVICIHSVHKGGMDNHESDPTKSQARGSGQTLHDADLILHMTKFRPSNDRERLIMPADQERMATLWVTKGRELTNPRIKNHLTRKGNSPFWGEAAI